MPWKTVQTGYWKAWHSEKSKRLVFWKRECCGLEKKARVQVWVGVKIKKGGGK